MKGIITTSLLLIAIVSSAQSPYLSILLKMDSAKAAYTRYKIEMKICKPKKMTERGDWFTHDTSKINFASLNADSVECGVYLDNEEKRINQFKFGNQVFAWERIFIFRIADASSRGWNPEMYVVMPMKYKSFVTHIKLNDVEFQSGKVIFLTDFNNEQKGSYLTIEQSLKNYEVVDVKTFPLKTILDK